MHKVGLSLLLVLSLALLGRAAGVSQEPPYSVETVTDLVYYRGPGFDPLKHRLDLYLPRGLTGAPVLIFIHGGAWVSGDKRLYSYLGRAFA